jgi:DNA repair protein RadA/Sms
MLLAVLEKRCGFRLAAKDVFLNIAGGIKVDDPAIDLAVAMAILSSNADLSIDKTISFAAEIGLSGELRPVNRLEQRLGELEKLGYKKIIVSKYSKGIKGHKHQIEIIPCTKIEEVVRAVFA